MYELSFYETDRIDTDIFKTESIGLKGLLTKYVKNPSQL